MGDHGPSWKPFLYRLLASWFCVPVAVAVVGALPIDDAVRDLLLPLVLVVLVWPIVGILSIFWAARLFATGRWPQAAVALILPASIVASVVTSGADWSNPIMSGACRLNRVLHFATKKRAYDAQIDALPGPSRFKLFVWESDPVGGSGVLYDATDDFVVLKKRRPRNWSRAESQHSETLDWLCTIEPVGSHYYIVTFGC